MTKKRKKDILFFVIVFAVAFISIILFGGCKTTKVVETAPPPVSTDDIPKDNYQNWNLEIQQKLESLGVEPLKISFLNSSDITLNQSLVKQIVEVIDGEVFLTDSVFKVEKVIGKQTLGVLKQKPKQLGQPMTISFSDSDKTYQMVFIFSKEENAYVLANTALFLFRGIEYKIIPKTNEKCSLLFSLKKEKIVTEINENAEGIPQQ